MGKSNKKGPGKAKNPSKYAKKNRPKAQKPPKKTSQELIDECKYAPESTVGDMEDPRIYSEPEANPFRQTVAIIQFPYDEGTVLNHGRKGGSKASKVFMEHMGRFGVAVNPEYSIDLSRWIHVVDRGSVKKKLKLEDAHAQLTKKVKESLDAGEIPFVIGGSNDQSYANASAFLDEFGKHDSGKRAVINIDAHLDVRPLLEGGKAHSGSPFRQLLEDERWQPKSSQNYFVEFAADGAQCSKAHADYVKKRKNAEIYWMGQLLNGTLSPAEQYRDVLKQSKVKGKKVFVSFDIDSIEAAYCPGVSCPRLSKGLTASDASQIGFYSGRSPSVFMMDCSEFNPKVESYNTGRMVANIFYNFLLGVAERMKSKFLGYLAQTKGLVSPQTYVDTRAKEKLQESLKEDEAEESNLQKRKDAPEDSSESQEPKVSIFLIQKGKKSKKKKKYSRKVKKPKKKAAK